MLEKIEEKSCQMNIKTLHDHQHTLFANRIKATLVHKLEYCCCSMLVFLFNYVCNYSTF